MLSNTDINLVKTLTFSIGLTVVSQLSHAALIDCQSSTALICAQSLQEVRTKLDVQNFTAYLISDAPLRLLDDTHRLWLNRAQQCKSLDCYRQQFDLRLDDLNLYTSLNQTLTQHYLKFEQGNIAKQPVHLKIHQLSKNNIKIEGIAYRNPNNQTEKQSLGFLAYTTPEQKNQVINNETDCSYDFYFQKSILKVNSSQKGCDRFNGIYRLYD